MKFTNTCWTQYPLMGLTNTMFDCIMQLKFMKEVGVTRITCLEPPVTKITFGFIKSLKLYIKCNSLPLKQCDDRTLKKIVWLPVCFRSLIIFYLCNVNLQGMPFSFLTCLRTLTYLKDQKETSRFQMINIQITMINPFELL